MEKVCEFCVTLRSVIYCKADAAHLCLSCDAKVHSANPLSSRHPRTLVCESCKYRPTYVRCYDHQLFMCRGCDQSQHDFSSQHRKRVISSYMGCPSAQDLAVLWGFDLNDFGASNNLHDQFVSTSSASVNVRVSSSSSRNSKSGVKSEVGPCSRYLKAFNSVKPKENTSYIVQQLLNLKKPQPTEDRETFSLIRHQEQTDISSSNSDPLKLENNFDQNLQQSNGHGNDLQHSGHPQHELEPYSLPFSQLDQLTSSSADGSPLHGDSFWQCKSPVQSGQLWSHNMQDLGVCEELVLDDLNIPDVDLTFINFEELFRGEQEQTEDMGMACSSMDTNTSLDRSDHLHATSVEVYLLSLPHPSFCGFIPKILASSC